MVVEREVQIPTNGTIKGKLNARQIESSGSMVEISANYFDDLNYSSVDLLA